MYNRDIEISYLHYLINIKDLVGVLAIVFCFFPYTMLIPSSSYTQPYAFIFSLIFFVLNLKWFSNQFPYRLKTSLILLALLGIVFFMLNTYPYNNTQDFKSLLCYVSPIIFTAIAYYFGSTKRLLFKKLTVISLTIWIVVSVIQLFIPNFLTFLVGTWSDAGVVNFLSGRGSMGFAPEPTHNGFHLIFLSVLAYLLGGNLILVFAGILSSLILAKSASSLLVLGIGIVVFLILKKPILSIVLGYFFLISLELISVLLINQVNDVDYRILSLITGFLDNPTNFLALDYSVNSRIGGVIIGFNEILNSFFLPNGMSNQMWLKEIEKFQIVYPWSLGISSAGLPSGYLLIIYQTGLFGFILLIDLLRKATVRIKGNLYIFLTICFFAIFVGQYMLSNPAFGIGLGVLTLNSDKSLEV